MSAFDAPVTVAEARAEQCPSCGALAGQPDPTELRCAHCGQRTDVDGAGRLWTYHPEGGEHWRAECAASPEGLHSVLCASQAPQ